MFFVMEDPMMPGEKIGPPPETRAREMKRPLATPARPARFSVSEGAEQYVGFWLVVLGIIGFLALVALIGFGPR
jgi:hypothetical protein